MRVLLVHNYYQQRGGEDAVFEGEPAILERAGHDVASLSVSNDSIDASGGIVARARVAAGTLWSRRGGQLVGEAARDHSADIVHFHNTFPLISPAAYWAAHAAGAAVVQTLHNYRLVCPKAVLFRDGAVCEDCLGRRVALPAIQHACYRDSRAGSTIVASMLATHRALGSWERKVDRYVALTEFQRAKLVEGGLPAARVAVSPNAVPSDPGLGAHDGGVLFVGRLSEEKGVRVLVEAWRGEQLSIPLRIVGDGPLMAELRTATADLDAVEVLGALPPDRVIEEMQQASALVFPSIWYEGCPMTILEAFATGLPVIASRLGGLPDLVDPERSGWHFTAGSAADLAAVIRGLSADPGALRDRQRGAREAYEQRFTPERLADRLTSIFEAAQRERHAAPR